jgi:hypothetical protein
MHFEVPKSKFASIREFAGEYLMIVVSIGTALLLEHTVQTVHHRHLAEEAAHRMEAETRDNIAELDRTSKTNRAEAQKLGKLRDALLKDIQDNVSDKIALGHFGVESKHSISLNMVLPSLRHEAWDVAVANQSASWMQPEVLQRYSGAYASVRDLQLAGSTTMSFLNGPQLIRTMTDLQLGSGTPPRDLMYALNQMIMSYTLLSSQATEISAQLKKALPPQEAKKA